MEIRETISILALILSVTSLVVSYFTGRYRDTRAIRPILVFEYREQGWFVHNIGSGPALDVVFTRLLEEKVTSHVRLPAIAKDSNIFLHFCKHDNISMFVATYKDFEGRKYSSESVDDISTTKAGYIIKRPELPIEQWWKLPENEK